LIVQFKEIKKTTVEEESKEQEKKEEEGLWNSLVENVKGILNLSVVSL
jgi:hypothetical protein